MKRIKGNKESFAIEWEVTIEIPYLMGHVCLWIDGIPVGAFEDESLLLCVKALIKEYVISLSQRERENFEFTQMSKEDVFVQIYDENLDNDYEKYWFHLGEPFDDFYLLAFTAGDEIHFVWKLRDEPFYNYPNYLKGVIHKKVK